MVEVRVKKKVWFPYTTQFRTADLQEAIIQYMVDKYPSKYKDRSDYIRQCIMREAKTVLEPKEFEWVCGKVFNDINAEVQ